MRALTTLFLLACAGSPQTATYQPLNSAHESQSSLPEIAAALADCSSCDCVERAWAEGAEVLATPYAAYPAVYGSAYPPYAYAGPYVGEYTGYDGFSFCGPYAGYNGYGGYTGYGAYGGYAGCTAVGEYVNALVQADARNKCDLFDKP